MPRLISSFLCILTHLMPQNNPTKLGTTIIFIFLVRTLRHGEVKHAAQGHVDAHGNTRIYTSAVWCRVLSC